ncbi:hypothetical protein DBR42_23270 [Pelomonas sp. HMWF004]|nr:hypothetical protein DBR42_23270 [Pelomonas sp. HMWF004]
MPVASDSAAAGVSRSAGSNTSRVQDARLSFRERVTSIAGAGGAILDFGCGTGTDAAWYAQRGHRVVAYDVSPGMVEVLKLRCQHDIESRRIALAVGGLDAMEHALKAGGPVAVIAANFAVLNHVQDLGPLLHQLAAHLLPGGALVGTVLNPLYRHDMRRSWWWRSAFRTLGAGPIQQNGKVTSYRHFVRAMRRAAGPEFVVEEVCAARSGTRLGMLDSDFLFVTLRRQP